MRASNSWAWFHALIIVICPQLAFCVICMYLPHITVHDLVVVDHHVSLMSLAFGGRGYIVRSRDTETDAGIGIEFDSTLGFPGEGPVKKKGDRKRKLVFKPINLEATAAAVMQQVQIQAGQVDWLSLSFSLSLSLSHTHTHTHTHTSTH